MLVSRSGLAELNHPDRREKRAPSKCSTYQEQHLPLAQGKSERLASANASIRTATVRTPSTAGDAISSLCLSASRTFLGEAVEEGPVGKIIASQYGSKKEFLTGRITR